MNEQQQFQVNIDARESAEVAMQFIESEWVDVPLRFWECLRDMCIAKLPLVPVVVAETDMDDLTARRFEHQYMPPKGIHASKAIRDVPTEYIAWWTDRATDNFTRQLQKYVKSARFRERQRAGE